MKKILSFILCLCLALAFVACAEANSDAVDFSDRIKLVYRDARLGIWVDTETNVMYLHKGYGFTVMLDENGDPLLWEDTEAEK